MSYQRPQIKSLIKRVSEKRRFIQVVLGPKQVGNTTLVTQLHKQIKSTHHFIADAVTNSDAVWIQQQGEVARQ